MLEVQHAEKKLDRWQRVVGYAKVIDSALGRSAFLFNPRRSDGSSRDTGALAPCATIR
jgi:hypothetical protein